MRKLLVLLCLFTIGAKAQQADSLAFLYNFMVTAVKPAFKINPKYELKPDVEQVMLINHIEQSIARDSVLMDTSGVDVIDTLHVTRYSGDSTYSCNEYVPHKEVLAYTFDGFAGYTIAQKRAMIKQLRQYDNFLWDRKRMGMTAKNNKSFYRISPPVFSPDKKEAYVCVEDLCPGLCGMGTILRFKLVNGNWESEHVQSWFH